MKLIDHIVYKDINSQNYFTSIQQIEDLIKKEKFTNNEFYYYFEMYEDDKVVVFANLAGFELSEEDIELEWGRPFQIETAILVKENMEIYFLRDNDGVNEYLKSFINKPYWTNETFENVGIKIAGDAGIGFRYRGLYWEDYI